MKCYNDPEREAVGICIRCGKAVCPEEAVIINDKMYCKECAEKIGKKKKLYRSRKDRVICGVCGGIAEYFNVDPTIIRILWVIVSIFGMAIIGGIILYFILCLVIPEEPLK